MAGCAGRPEIKTEQTHKNIETNEAWFLAIKHTMISQLERVR